MKKYVKYIVAVAIVLVFAFVVAWKDSQGVTVTIDENSESDYMEEEDNTEEGTVSDEDRSVDRYDYENLEYDEDDHAWNWKLLEEDKIYDSGFYLLRDDKIYSLNDKNITEYDLSGRGHLYDRIDMDSGENALLALPFVPTPIIKSGDSIVAYSEQKVPVLNLWKVDSYGWSIPTYYTGNRIISYDEDGYRSEYGEGSNEIKFAVADSENEAVVDDPYNLTPYESYYASWSIGTTSDVSPSQDALCRVFVTDKKVHFYRIEGSLTGKGYAEYDLSEIPVGTYMTGGHGGGGLMTIE